MREQVDAADKRRRVQDITGQGEELVQQLLARAVERVRGSGRVSADLHTRARDLAPPQDENGLSQLVALASHGDR